MRKWSLCLVGLGLVFVASSATAQQQCADDFAKLRAAAEARAGELRAASDRKAPQEEVCKRFKGYSAAEAKMLKYMEDNQAWCQIPPQAVGQLKSSHQRTLATQTKVCAARPAGPPPRALDGIGSLSAPSALNAPNSAPINPTTQGAGVFSTLGGAR